MIFRKKPKQKSYDKDNMKPVIKCSICNGEQVAGFQDIHTGAFEEDILVDEALAIASEIAAWKEKKAGEERMVKRPVDVLRARIGALSAPVPRI